MVDKLILAIMLPLWWLIVVTPDWGAVYAYILNHTDPLFNVVVLGIILIAARFSELHRTGRLPELRREIKTEYAVEFEDESEVWNADD